MKIESYIFAILTGLLHQTSGKVKKMDELAEYNKNIQKHADNSSAEKYTLDDRFYRETIDTDELRQIELILSNYQIHLLNNVMRKWPEEDDDCGWGYGRRDD